MITTQGSTVVPCTAASGGKCSLGLQMLGSQPFQRRATYELQWLRQLSCTVCTAASCYGLNLKLDRKHTFQSAVTWFRAVKPRSRDSVNMDVTEYRRATVSLRKAI